MSLDTGALDTRALDTDARATRCAIALDLARLVWQVRLPLAFSLGLLACVAALAPSIGWMGKAVLDRLGTADGDLHVVLVEHGLLFGALFTALTALRIAEKPVGKFAEARIIVAMQNTYMARRAGHPDVAQMLVGCDTAKKGLKVLYDDVPVMAFTIVSVGVWQAALAPQWLPVMVVSAVPAAVAVWCLGPLVRRASAAVLDAQSGIAGAAGTRCGTTLGGHQRDWVSQSVFMEFFKGIGEESMNLMIWGAFVALTMALYAQGSDWLPERTTPGEFALVVVNLALIADPLSKIGKIFIHFQEASPAIHRVFRP